MPLEHFPIDRRKKRPGGSKGSKFGYARPGAKEQKDYKEARKHHYKAAVGRGAIKSSTRKPRSRKR